MKFTFETEKNSTLPFLGIFIERLRDQFSTTVYRKETFTGLYTNFETCMPARYKIGLIKTLLYRAFKLCSSGELLRMEIDAIKKFLLANGYCASLLDSVVRSLSLKHSIVLEKVQTVEKLTINIVLPFLGRFSIDLRRNLRKFLKNAYPHINFRFAFVTVEKIGSRFKIKQQLPIELLSNVVYKFKCHRCDAAYIGKSSRNFGIRRGEHLGLSIRTGKAIKPDPNSSIFLHHQAENHELSIENFKIIDRAKNNFQCTIKESFHIVNSKPSLNIQLDQDALIILQQ